MSDEGTIKVSIEKSSWVWFAIYIGLLAIIWDTQHWSISIIVD